MTALITEMMVILSNLSVNKYAVAPGVISIATTRTIPTDCNPTTAAKDKHVSNKSVSYTHLTLPTKA